MTDTFYNHLFPNATTRLAFELFADWVWDRFASKHVPNEFVEELDGLGDQLASITRRFNVLANMPADTKNLITLLEQELEKGLPQWEQTLLNKIINHLDGCTWCDGGPTRVPHRKRLPTAPRCDAFATWGSRAKGGRLFSSRNLDWTSNTGAAASKLITVFDIVDEKPVLGGPYATFGFATGFGAVAGMSSKGITVAEMNLDNSYTTFDGPPFPIRLRMILERSDKLSTARKVWESTNNTDSMNYMIASATERNAYAIEAIGGRFKAEAPYTSFSGFFHANDTIEADATCVVGKTGGGTCGTGDVPAGGGKVKHIGLPLPEAVWRTNHALHPTIMATQEPLFNDTTYRYKLLRSMFDEQEAKGPHAIGEVEAVSIAATLGIKGPDFFSCDPKQFGEHASHVMSVVYAPEDEEGGQAAWVSWEDSTPELKKWRPAACNPYVRVAFSGRFW